MSWMNSAFYMPLLTTVSGSIAFGLWLVWEKYLERHERLKCVFPLLVIVLIFFAIPFVYIGIMLTIHDFEQGVIYGPVFWQTPFIHKMQCVMAGIWLIGAIINLRNYKREYTGFRTILKKNIYVREQALLEQSSRIQQNLGLSGEVQIAINYGVKVPIVCGWFKKKIILPVRDYTEEELEVILYHEMTHIRQHILELKQIGIILKLIYWFNPLMNIFLNKLDEWGETECDLQVLSNPTITFTKKQYFNVALAGLEDIDIWLPQMVTQLRKERTLKKRVERMKKYKKEKDLRLAGGILIGCLFLAVSGTSVYAMGMEFCDAYKRVYDETVVEEKIEQVPMAVIEVAYDEEEDDFAIAEGIILYNGSISIEWEVPAYRGVVAENAIRLEKGERVSVSMMTDPSGKSMRVGFLTPYGTKMYVEGSGLVNPVFEIKKDGDYKLFVENIDSVAFTVTGSVLYQ